MKVTEKELWYLLDTLAVRESSMGGNFAKAQIAEQLMSQLPRPTPDECRQMFRRGLEVERG